jgi:DinB superfamily
MHSIEEKNELLQQLDEARERLNSAVWGLSEKQSNFKPSPGAWSIAGVVEHLATVEGFVLMRAGDRDDYQHRRATVFAPPNSGNWVKLQWANQKRPAQS